MTKTYAKGIRGQIVRGRWHNAAGGISEHYDEVIVVGEGVPEVLPVGAPDLPVVVVGETTPGYVVLRPAAPVADGRIGYMASGAYVASSGPMEYWREAFGHNLPIPLLDYAEKYNEDGYLD
jgi:hypothetical protein